MQVVRQQQGRQSASPSDITIDVGVAVFLVDYGETFQRQRRARMTRSRMTPEVVMGLMHDKDAVFDGLLLLRCQSRRLALVFPQAGARPR